LLLPQTSPGPQQQEPQLTRGAEQGFDVAAAPMDGNAPTTPAVAAPSAPPKSVRRDTGRVAGASGSSRGSTSSSIRNCPGAGAPPIVPSEFTSTAVGVPWTP